VKLASAFNTVLLKAIVAKEIILILAIFINNLASSSGAPHGECFIGLNVFVHGNVIVKNLVFAINKVRYNRRRYNLLASLLRTKDKSFVLSYLCGDVFIDTGYMEQMTTLKKPLVVK